MCPWGGYAEGVLGRGWRRSLDTGHVFLGLTLPVVSLLSQHVYSQPRRLVFHCVILARGVWGRLPKVVETCLNFMIDKLGHGAFQTSGGEENPFSNKIVRGFCIPQVGRNYALVEEGGNFWNPAHGFPRGMSL